MSSFTYANISTVLAVWCQILYLALPQCLMSERAERRQSVGLQMGLCWNQGFSPNQTIPHRPPRADVCVALPGEFIKPA